MKRSLSVDAHSLHRCFIRRVNLFAAEHRVSDLWKGTEGLGGQGGDRGRGREEETDEELAGAGGARVHGRSLS